MESGMSDMSVQTSTAAAQSLEMVLQRIDEISALGEARKRDASDWFVALHGGATVDFLTQEELAEMHTLKMKLPTFTQLRLEASERLKARIASRKRGPKANSVV
jgi:hypothetical protein